ncbi:response regulator [Paenibacillus lautus]|uniref:response regulator n=1 Tax=Paenibacillus lautus TaxID=1401 RepID=UPI002DBB2CC3|nr:response regulator [Paenibacillus lautus]MEC0258862.1 response regulator [Paenibacillus lautus]
MQHVKTVKMLIVDDEPVICQGLHYTIDWADYGVEVVAEAYDGHEALQVVKEHGIDLVLTDIRMEGMDGLQLAKELKRCHPEVRVIMISGYEEFEYARQAIKLDVTDYLLKPVDIDELVAAVTGIVEDIRSRDTRVNSPTKDAELWLSEMAAHYETSLAKSIPPYLLNSAEYKLIATQLEKFSILAASQTEQDFMMLQRLWLQTVRESLEKSGIRQVSVFVHKNLLMTLLMTDQPRSKRQWDEILQTMLDDWPEEHRLYGAVSDTYVSLDQTAAICAEVRALLPYYALEKHSLLDREYKTEVDNGRAMHDFDSAEMVSKLSVALFKQDADMLEELIESMFRLFLDQRYLLTDMVKVCDELSIMLRQRLRQSGLTQLEHGLERTIDLEVFNHPDAIRQAISTEVFDLLQLIDKVGIDRSFWIIEKAKKYMADHYLSDLKASEVAAYLKITPSYFSNIFKQSTGKSFSEYMNELRINEARKLLLTTQDKVFEIADRVGYKEYKYFVSVFKLYTGMTPKKYRVLNIKE